MPVASKEKHSRAQVYPGLRNRIPREEAFTFALCVLVIAQMCVTRESGGEFIAILPALIYLLSNMAYQCLPPAYK